MPIELKRLAPGGRHTVVVKLPFEGEQGKTESQEMRVVYRGVSMEEGEAIEKAAIAEAKVNERNAVANALAQTVLELPDMIDNGQPVAPTPEFFKGLDTFYLNRINRAIQEDRNGPNQ